MLRKHRWSLLGSVAGLSVVASGCVSAAERDEALDTSAFADASVDEQTQPLSTASMTGLFPEMARATKLEGTTSDYSTEACMPISFSTMGEMVTLPSADLGSLFSALGVSAPSTLIGANTLKVGGDLVLSNTDSVELDSPMANEGVNTQSFRTQGGIIVADRIRLAGALALKPGVTYILVGRKSIDFETFSLEGTSTPSYFYTLQPSNSPAASGIRVTYAKTSGPAGGTATKTTVSGAPKAGAAGVAGPNLILITPKVNGSIRATLTGGSGQDAESLPKVICDNDWMEKKTDWACSTELSADSYEDRDCWDKQGESLVGAASGAGGRGGRFVLISDSTPSVTGVSMPGGVGGLATLAGDKQWGNCDGTSACNWYPATGLYCDDRAVVAASKSYGKAGTKGANGTAGPAAKTLALSGRIRDITYWLGGRAARRDMLNARYYSLNTDPDQSAGNANRDKAIALYGSVINTFCEDGPVSTTPPGIALPDGEVKERTSICNEARRGLSYMENDLNVFGVPYDMVVYANPKKLLEQRDRYYAVFRDSYARSFDTAVAASGDPMNSFMAYVAADATAAKSAAMGERSVLMTERDGAHKNALLAWKELEQNQDRISQKSADMKLVLMPDLQEALSPPDTAPSLFEQLVGPFQDLYKIGKEVFDVVSSAYSQDYLGVYTNYKQLLSAYKNADNLYPRSPGLYDLSIPLPKQITSGGFSKVGDALCSGQVGSTARAFVELDRMRNAIPSNARSPAKARAIIDALKRLLGDIEQASDKNCGLWRNFVDLTHLSLVADERVALADQNVLQKTSLEALAAQTARDQQAQRKRFDLQRDTACKEAHHWADQVLLYDFLAGRAQHFVTGREPSTPSSVGNFRFDLLKPASREAYTALHVTDGLDFSGFTPSTRIRSDYLMSSADCAPGGAETVARCEAERGVLGQLLDTGLAHLVLENGPARFGVHTELNSGRVTSAKAILLGPSTTYVANDVKHDSVMTFASGSTLSHAVFPTNGTRKLCDLLQQTSGALASRYTSFKLDFGCGNVADKFEVGANVAQPDLIALGQPFAEAADQWNLFGASTRRSWRVDFRDAYRRANLADRCYSTLAAGSANAASAECIGEAFMPSNCAQLRARALAGETDLTAQANTCITNALASRVSAFASQCSANLTDAGGTLWMTGNPPVACDRVCGPACKRLKESTTGMRFDLTVRSSN